MEIDIKDWLNREGEAFLEDIGIKKGDVVFLSSSNFPSTKLVYSIIRPHFVRIK
ncbi:unnamed protein product [marine sediment metagenome]|uniref:Uncharacterized protein n=1 Tax=marine sediment metagenome TaxID=412755 RepID=X1EWT4_9ZZZZ